MHATPWDRLETLFQEALARAPDERTAWLRRVCAGDPELYHQVAGLLSADSQPAAIFDGIALDALRQADAATLFGEPARPERVGPWRVAEHLGAGGMGTVFRAERVEPFRQTVALKLVKRGHDTEATLARFRAERQILARLDHPGIARLVDGGLAGPEAGLYADRPYFAMEYVDGEPITAYCDRRRLGLDARLRLVEQAAEAVAYAHRNLVVHRDLKPSNLLVADGGTDGGTGGEGGPRVKLLDFGIAKLLADGDDAGVLTQTGQRPFTPAYAAPEQLRGAAVTTATDVYGLGGILYRLLAGRRAFPVAGRSAAEVELAVLHDDPPRPSLVAKTDPAAADACGTTPDALARRLSGDLDAIVLRALRKDAGDRYPTVADLLADLRRYREGRPVEARVGSRAYRARRFVRRHRGRLAASAAAVLALALVGALAFVRVAAERDRATAEAAKAAEVTGFLTSMLEAADPYLAQGDTLSAFDILEAGAARIDRELADQPEVRAEMLLVVGGVYDNLGQPDTAEPLVRRSLELRRDRWNPQHPAVAESALRLGRVLRRLDATDEAERLFLEVIATSRDRGAEIPEARAQRQLGSLLRDRGAFDEAEALYASAIATFERAGPGHHADLWDTQNSLAVLLESLGRHAEAAAVLREVVAAERAAGVPEFEQAPTLATLGNILREQGQLVEAETIMREAVAINERAFGPDHLVTATAYRNLASLLRDLEQYDEAAALYERALAVRRRELGPTHRRVANLLNSYTKLYDETGDTERALELQREVVRIYQATETPEPTRYAAALFNLGGYLDDLDRRREAERWYRLSVATLAGALPEDSPELAFPLTGYGTALTRWGRAGEALPLLRRAVALRRAALEPAAPLTALSERRLADALAGAGRPDEARRLLRTSIGRLTESGADADLVARARDRLDTLAARP